MYAEALWHQTSLNKGSVPFARTNLWTVVWVHLTTRCQALGQQVRVAMVTVAEVDVINSYKLIYQLWNHKQKVHNCHVTLEWFALQVAVLLTYSRTHNNIAAIDSHWVFIVHITCRWSTYKGFLSISALFKHTFLHMCGQKCNLRSRKMSCIFQLRST